jgi:hypothetical protein
VELTELAGCWRLLYAACCMLPLLQAFERTAYHDARQAVVHARNQRRAELDDAMAAAALPFTSVDQLEAAFSDAVVHADAQLHTYLAYSEKCGVG